MTSVFRFHPDDLRKKMIYLNYVTCETNYGNNFNFLDCIIKKYPDIDIDIYYDIINSIDEYKLKNLLYFINIRLKNIDEQINYNNKISYEKLNILFKEYINNDLTKSIIIMNFIQQYIYPLK